MESIGKLLILFIMKHARFFNKKLQILNLALSIGFCLYFLSDLQGRCVDK